MLVLCIWWLALATGACQAGWQLAGPFGGTATTIAVDPNHPQTLLAGARNSLLFRSIDGGQSWTRLPLPGYLWGDVTSALVDPGDGSRYLAGLSGPRSGMVETLDGGAHWQVIGDLEGIPVQAIAISASTPAEMAAGTRQGVYLSVNSGRNWRRISPPDNLQLQAVTAVAIDPRAPDTIYAGTTHLPWKSMDAGKTWHSIHSGMIDDSDVFSLFVDPAKPERVFASACSGIYGSRNSGELWAKFAGIPNTHRRTHVIRQDPSRPETIYAGTTMGLQRSEDGGSTWKQLNNYQVNWMAFDPDGKTMYLATEHYGVLKSADRGATVEAINHGFASRGISDLTVSGKRLYAVSSHDGNPGLLFDSDDGGLHWRTPSGGEGLAPHHIVSVTGAPADDKTLFAASAARVFRSSDSGRTWKPLPTPAVPVKRGAAPASVRIHCLQTVRHGKAALLAGTDRGLFRSLDSGATWTLVSTTGLHRAVVAIYPAADFGARVVVRTSAELFASDDGGGTWRALALPVAIDAINDVAPAAQGSALLAATAQGMYRSPDGGATWPQVRQGLPVDTVTAVRYHPVRPLEAFAVEFGRLYRSQDDGISWMQIPEPDSSLGIRKIWLTPLEPELLFGATSDVGLAIHSL